jgi:hypothetical protein
MADLNIESTDEMGSVLDNAGKMVAQDEQNGSAFKSS